MTPVIAAGPFVFYRPAGMSVLCATLSLNQQIPIHSSRPSSCDFFLEPLAASSSPVFSEFCYLLLCYYCAGLRPWVFSSCLGASVLCVASSLGVFRSFHFHCDTIVSSSCWFPT